MAIANRIREMREAAGLTQDQLGERLGVSRQTIISLERGRYTASLELAWKLAQLFGMAIEELFQFDGEEVSHGS